MFFLLEILVVVKIIFDCVVSDENDGMDCLYSLEIYLQSSSNVVVKQQQEINELQTLCETLEKVSELHHIVYETGTATNASHYLFWYTVMKGS
jgi:hypothetical protein